MEKAHYILIDGEKVPVTEEVYHAFKRPAWKERKRRQMRSEKERSLEAFMDEGFDIPSEQALVDEIVEDKLLLDVLLSALAELTDEERSLIDALFYQDKSEREVARELGIAQTTLNYQKTRILKWLKKKLTNNL